MPVNNPTRQDVRRLVESHAKRQFDAEGAGCWHAVQNDLNDELADITGRIENDHGNAQAQRFGRMYSEEVLAFERDFRSNPVKATERVFNDGKPVQAQKQRQPQVLQIEGPKSSGLGWAIFFVIIAGLFFFH